jgi:hypothetical protein
MQQDGHENSSDDNDRAFIPVTTDTSTKPSTGAFLEIGDAAGDSDRRLRTATTEIRRHSFERVCTASGIRSELTLATPEIPGTGPVFLTTTRLGGTSISVSQRQRSVTTSKTIRSTSHTDIDHSRKTSKNEDGGRHNLSSKSRTNSKATPTTAGHKACACSTTRPTCWLSLRNKVTPTPTCKEDISGKESRNGRQQQQAQQQQSEERNTVAHA